MKALITSTLFALGLCSCAPQGGENGNELTMLVGTYTNGASTGIYTFGFDQGQGTSRALDSIVVPNPSYLTASADGRRVYAVSEKPDSSAALVTLDFDPSNGHLSLLGSQPTCGGDPCYVSTNGKWVLTANYSGGSLSVFPLRADGTADALATLFRGTATGPDSIRQADAHVHCAVFAPDGKHVFATDFSADRLLRFDIMDNGLASAPDSTSTSLPPDYGPRHLIFAPDGRHAYVIGELSGTVTAMRYEGGRLDILQTLAADTTGARGSADIRISPDGRFLYASNRLRNDGLAIFAIHPTEGTLTLKGYQQTGLHPRNFNITPNGRYLLVACRDSHVIQVYERDTQTGALTDTGRDIRVDQPVCIQFVNKP